MVLTAASARALPVNPDPWEAGLALDGNAEVDLAIAGIARETGQTSLAVIHYRRFLTEKKRDARTSSVEDIIAELSPPPDQKEETP
jgi:hypothetical protein